MGANIPVQTRTVDPFASYNSNVVNQLTRMVTRGVNCLAGPPAINVTSDPGNPLTGLIISTGICFKDDVIIEFTSPTSVDMHNDIFYLSANHMDEEGYYYICLNYTYVKSRPAPEAAILILKPSEYSSGLPSGCFFLKAVRILNIGGIFQIVSLHNQDPLNPSVKRIYTQTYFAMEDTLISFIRERDEGRVIYVQSEDQAYFGTSIGWVPWDSFKESLDTISCPVGSLVYLNSSGSVDLAIATSRETLATAVVYQTGLVSEGTGKVKLFGSCYNVPVEAGKELVTGDRLYLSEIQAGSVTPLIPVPYGQFVGICVSFDNISSTCTMWFFPGNGVGTDSGSGTSDNSIDMYTDLLSQSIFNKLIIDCFINDDLIDNVNTSAILNNVYYRIDGTAGKEFHSKNLASGYSSWIPSCQITATVLNPINYSWFVSNSQHNNEDFEPLQLNTLHYFSTLKIPVTSGSVIDFSIGETIRGNTSNATAIVSLYTKNSSILVKDNGTFQVGETITGLSSGATSIISGIPEDRNTSSYNKIYVKCIFNDTDSISDYGVLFEEDSLIIGYTLPAGASGYSGRQGPQGTSGYSGLIGASGLSGYSSYSGLSGYSGINGMLGSEGFSGYSGFSGGSGYSGLDGISGYSGIIGFSGYSGRSGYSGLIGPIGISGYSGNLGISGYSGIDGLNGMPSSNIDNYIPQWDGNDSKLLKNGVEFKTILANPGSDSVLVSEKGIRTAISLMENLGLPNQKIFTNITGTSREWAYGFKVIINYNELVNAGYRSYTGVGFKPSAIVLFSKCVVPAPTNIPCQSLGFSDGISQVSALLHPTQFGFSTMISYMPTTAQSYGSWGTLISFDNDGFTIYWDPYDGKYEPQFFALCFR